MATPTQPIERGPSKVFLQRIDGLSEPIVVEFPSAQPLPKNFGGERWWTGCDTGPGFGETVNISFEVSTTPEARAALKRMAEQSKLDNMVNAVRATLLMGFAPFHWEMEESLYRHVSAICHRLHRMNLTRYLRSRIRYTARGIHVFLKSGAMVWKK